MLLTINKTETIKTEEVIELKTPAYFKSSFDEVYMINEAGNIINIYISETFCNHMVKVKDEKRIQEIINTYKPCSSSEFFAAQDEYLARLKKEIVKSELHPA